MKILVDSNIVFTTRTIGIHAFQYHDALFAVQRGVKIIHVV